MSKKGLHVAFIMDGNGRWAQKQGKPRFYGHQKGAQTLKQIIRAAPELPIHHMTFYAFSCENNQRHSQEVEGIIGLFEDYLREEIDALHDQNVCLRFIGERTDPLPEALCSLMQWAEDRTRNNDGLGVQIAFNYSGRREIVHAFKQMAYKIQDGQLQPNELDEKCVQDHLWTSPWPEPDMLVRTGGEYRLSNFLLWQLSYTEFFFLPTYWPDLSVEQVRELIACYQGRHRRFGKVLT